MTVHRDETERLIKLRKPLHGKNQRGHYGYDDASPQLLELRQAKHVRLSRIVNDIDC
eukprot:XP_001708145.1 Hypothetical protein GL50803_35356 [Giardia lamblia ATCC 50803]